MLVSPQNTLVDNIWSRCCIRNSCQRDCSLKLVAWYKVCNKTPNDQPKIIDKRDRQGQNPAFSEFDLFARFTQKLRYTKLPYSLNLAIAKAF